MINCEQFLIIDTVSDIEVLPGDLVTHWTTGEQAPFIGIITAPGPYNVARVMVSTGQDRDSYGYTCTQWHLAIMWREGSCAHLIDWSEV